jgi:formaldehyde-activating enzyme involved in methanogenesis
VFREAEVARTAAQLEKEAAEQDRRAWPYRLAAQQTAVAAARERYEAARKLLEEKTQSGKNFRLSALWSCCWRKAKSVKARDCSN